MLEDNDSTGADIQKALGVFPASLENQIESTVFCFIQTKLAAGCSLASIIKVSVCTLILYTLWTENIVGQTTAYYHATIMNI